MKKLIILLFVFACTGVYSQTKPKKETKEERKKRYIEEVNPFRKNGYKPRVITLSNGKYREAFPDTIVQIGSFTYNKKTKQITGVWTIENLGYSEATLKPDLVSRWFSPDPLSDEFPDKSPYNFVDNNPILYVDPDGLAPMTVIGADKKSQQNIKNQLPASSQKYVKFDSNGKLDAGLLAQGAKANSGSGNYQRLLHLANSDDTYVFSSADHYHASDADAGGDIITVGMKGSKLEPNGSIGITLYADKTVTGATETSIDENTNIVVSNKVDDGTQAKTTAHEVVHAFLYDLMKNHGGTTEPNHQFIPATDKDGNIYFRYTSPKLIKPAEKEATKNYNENKKKNE
jgi:hypothetical protein